MIADTIDNLDAIVGQNGVDYIGNSSDEMTQELRGNGAYHPIVQLDKSKLGSAINGNKQVQLPFFGLHFGNVEVKIADGIGFEPAFLRCPGDLRQAVDAMSLQATM